MTAPFPLSPYPTNYPSVTPTSRYGIIEVGQGITFTLSGPHNATAYSVRDYRGNVVSSGSVSGTSVTPTPPTGGWLPGWYRFYLTGTTNDAVFGFSMGTSSFCVVKTNANFPTNPSAATSVAHDGGDGATADQVIRGVMALGPSRFKIGDVTNASAAVTAVSATAAAAATYYTAYATAARPRPLLVSFPNGTSDPTTFAGSVSGTFLKVYPKTYGTAAVYVAVSAGTASGTKVQVYSPNSSTLVETYDNQASSVAATAAINAASAYVYVVSGGQTAGASASATLIARTKIDAVPAIASSLYTAGITHFEGPSNEPGRTDETGQQMRLFYGAVKAGNASAKVVGPQWVSNNWDEQTTAVSWLTAWGAYVDEFSYHWYNGCLGDLNLGRYNLEAQTATFTAIGWTKPVWQTEQGVFTPVYGVYHPRRARWSILQVLLQEQYGIPRERNHLWYDSVEGYWPQPAWFLNGNHLNPQPVLFRVLDEETHGMAYTSRVTFGSVGDKVFLGSLYTAGSGARTMVLLAGSAMPGATITLAVSGASSVTVVDGLGVVSTVTVSGGYAVIPVSEIPTYVRLPVGVTATTFRCNDWPQISDAPKVVSSATFARPSAVAGNPERVIDGAWRVTYDGTNRQVHLGSTTLPDSLTLRWDTATRVDRVLIWAGHAWQSEATLLDFDVQTSNDGATWATQATVTKTDATSFLHGAAGAGGAISRQGTGTQRETYWDEQWIYDVRLPAPVTCQYVRLNVRATSYGGEPDAACVVTGGQGDVNQRMCIQEIAVLCDDNTRLQVVRH